MEADATAADDDDRTDDEYVDNDVDYNGTAGVNELYWKSKANRTKEMKEPRYVLVNVLRSFEPRAYSCCKFMWSTDDHFDMKRKEEGKLDADGGDSADAQQSKV
ncbi:uncharacterized protein MONOS_15791 [Monocercomonoides exilis]|uniref:uncharacterized protein n=1 Tax=Monocercomonoides exilis TaxID=2049356 RepID=UPI0035594EB9|nr:hypothetical protein MONOS_15791 [Monocercomonoides exilis]|eukprot:MONOS_15791.1-p1 / transcript=MONOS_15791.1 / gene=MONOS_15791 / organism=Monocercomonoides_exilis_PA203 / gene_product=unspecified product / transcript_product=unspecified product / location=Mono_scaffold01358:4342-4816(+) / protein_length=104 / sequence_SO=supercontig / SO=protein_coding / is_pseudo=false